jgi:NAD(P)-dependent dehydrogenase (short-subunit alcohol dehydrogenase family)
MSPMHRGQALADELGALYVHCDVGDKAQAEALVARTMQAHGRIDVLVNNAGIFKAADFLDVTRRFRRRAARQPEGLLPRRAGGGARDGQAGAAPSST